MDLLDLIKLVVRRWYVAVPVVIVTLAAAVALGSAIQPEYNTTATVILVPPTTSAASPANGATPAPGNPWLRIGETQMAQAVQIAVSSGETRQKVVAAGGDSAYEITLVTRSSIMTVEISSETSAKALATVEAVTKLISDEVVSQQAKYKPKAGEEITTQVLDPGLNVTPSRSNVLRAQIVVLAVIYRPLLFASIDAEVAIARGVPVRVVGLVFVYLLALTVTEAAQIVGTLLVLSLAITPAAAARRFTANPGRGAVLAVVIALVAADGGLLLSWQFDNIKASFFISAIGFAIYLVARLVDLRSPSAKH